MNILIDKLQGCGDGFLYVCPECKWKDGGRNYWALFDRVVKHRLANNHPVGLNYELLFQDNLCAVYKERYPEKECCKDADAPPPEVYQPPNIMRQAVSAFTDFTQWVKNGMPVTDTRIAEDRYKICKDCPYWNGMEFFGLGRCRKCGCCAKLKIGMATTKCPMGRW